MRKYIVRENTTLGAFTDNTDAQASFVFRTLLKEREIRVNGAKVATDISLSAGDEVCYYMTPAQESRTAFRIVYEDGNVVAVDKESGVNCEAVFSELSRKGEVFPVHRLDRNTEGILILAKTKEAEEELLVCFRARRVRKIYLAVVVGKMPKVHSVEEAYLEKDPSRAFAKVGERGEKIVTEYRVLEERGTTSLLEITLHTGKTHQIRAHLAYLRHPVAGDGKYGDAAFNKRNHLTRQRLLSKSLEISSEGVLSYLKGKPFVSEKTL